MSFLETSLARELHAVRQSRVEESRHARRVAAVTRLQRRAERLSHKAERAARRAENADSQARLAVARAI